MTRYRVPGPDEMDPDWGVDPDVDEHFPDDATIARDLEEDERRLQPPRSPRQPIWPFLLLAASLASVAAAIVPFELDQREWSRLVRAGGERHYLSATERCRSQPVLPRTGARRWGGRLVQVGTSVDVVTREGGWSLVGFDGSPCWLPDWSLSRTLPDMRAIYRCGTRCHARAPAGWEAAQRQAACRYSFNERLTCLQDDLFLGPERPSAIPSGPD